MWSLATQQGVRYEASREGVQVSQAWGIHNNGSMLKAKQACIPQQVVLCSR